MILFYNFVFINLRIYDNAKIPNQLIFCQEMNYSGIIKNFQGIQEKNKFDSFEEAFDMMSTTLSQQTATCACTTNILLFRCF